MTAAREARRRLAEEARALRECLEGDLEAGIAWIPWEGRSPAERLAAPVPSASPRPAAPPAAPPAAGAAAGAAGAAPRDLSRASRERALAAVAAEVAACTRCRLCEGRTNTVPGEGDPGAAVMFVGEGPGEQEDRTGRPFVGRAGQLLRKMIREELGLDPAEVFIANIVKCRPPQNRAPMPDEAAACLPFLRRQCAAVRPRVLVTLGNPSTQSLLQTTQGITKMRGRPVVRGGFTFFPTYHPSYLLRNPAAEPEGRADFRAVRAMLEEGPGAAATFDPPATRG
jgi:uracil-DNA glycosylase